MPLVESMAGANQEVENGEKLDWEGVAKCSVCVNFLFVLKDILRGIE